MRLSRKVRTDDRSPFTTLILGTFTAGLTLLTCAATPVQAQLTTLNFDGLTRGSILTNQLQAQGILVSGTSGGSGLTPGQVLDVTQGDVGVLDFGGSLPNAILYGVVGDNLRIDFVLPNGTPTTVGTVSLRVGDGDAASESFRVSIFNSGSTLITSQDFTTTSGPVGGGANVSFSNPGIARLEVLGIGNASGGAIDNLTFGTVSSAAPEPGSLALLLLPGIAAVRAYRRRQG